MPPHLLKTTRPSTDCGAKRCRRIGGMSLQRTWGGRGGKRVPGSPRTPVVIARGSPCTAQDVWTAQDDGRSSDSAL
eukprot:CAMPEP_0195149058 /NCGR_PEP_ID=MMETSP0448-20130528/176371_1 /TAXON_ID=66468 /ORGANISM="Heterocapsa triquestra, Strain CCMP 448" /LENGTH=75 /DNA_ID=CAMNT_0040187685 /DNA_START=88 /DNA_END=313 /DNA_ORIENTATION=+